MKPGEVWCAELSSGDAQLDRQHHYAPEQWAKLAETVTAVTKQPWKPCHFRVSKYFDRNTKKQVPQQVDGPAAEQGQVRYRYHCIKVPNCVNDHAATVALAAARWHCASTVPTAASSINTGPQSSPFLQAVESFPQLVTQMMWQQLSSVEKLDLMAVCRQLAELLGASLRVKHVLHASAFTEKQPFWVSGVVKTLRISSYSARHAEHGLWPELLKAIVHEEYTGYGRARRGAPASAPSVHQHVIDQLQAIEELQVNVHGMPLDSKARDTWQAILPLMLPKCTRLQITIPPCGGVNSLSMCQASWTQMFASMHSVTQMEIVGQEVNEEMVLGAVGSISSLQVLSVDTPVFNRVLQHVASQQKYLGQPAKQLRRKCAASSGQQQGAPQRKKQRRTEQLQHLCDGSGLVHLVQRDFGVCANHCNERKDGHVEVLKQTVIPQYSSNGVMVA